ncbi:MAG: nitronate monooxygenase, partial [Chloroflexi bacterium]
MPDMAQPLHTPLCRELGIEYPIFCAGIGTAAGPDLAAAVSNAGGFGVVGASSFLADAMPALIGRIRERTTRPFGVNFIIDERDSSDEDRAITRRQVSAAITERVAAVILFWGDPAPYVEEAHRHGVRIIIQVGSVDEAIKPLPVLASGGIGDGTGLARAIRLGAQGVSLGTRFVASDEAWCHAAYKQRIVESTASDTVLNELYDVWWPNAPHRTLRNKTFVEWEAAGRPPSGQRPGEGTSIGKKRMGSGEVVEWPRYAIGTAPPDFEGDIEYAPLWAGESCSVVNDVKPAGD